MTGTSIKSILAIALLVGVATQANADIWLHVDKQAADIERATKALRTQVDHYRHTRFYGQLIGATARVKGKAIHVHNIARHSRSTKSLKSAVKHLSSAFNDAQDLFDRAEYYAASGDGQIRGNTAHVKKLLNQINDCIYYLQDDLRKLTPVKVVKKAYRAPTPVKYSARGKSRSAYSRVRQAGLQTRTCQEKLQQVSQQKQRRHLDWRRKLTDQLSLLVEGLIQAKQKMPSEIRMAFLFDPIQLSTIQP